MTQFRQKKAYVYEFAAQHCKITDSTNSTFGFSQRISQLLKNHKIINSPTATRLLLHLENKIIELPKRLIKFDITCQV